MTAKPLVIFGTGEIADVAFFYFTHDTSREIAAFSCNADRISEKSFHGLAVVPFETVEKQYPAREYDMFIAVGYSKLNTIRKQKYLEAKAKGYHLPGYISSKATLWDAALIGDNCFILEHNNIQPYAKIGNNVTLWSGNHIGHHTCIKDHCFITSHVVVSGGVTVEENCFIGVNATLRDHITVRSDCIIGAGAYIAADTEPGKVYPGKSSKPLAVGSSELDHI